MLGKPAYGPIWHHLLLYGLQAKNGSYMLND